ADVLGVRLEEEARRDLFVLDLVPLNLMRRDHQLPALVNENLVTKAVQIVDQRRRRPQHRLIIMEVSDRQNQRTPLYVLQLPIPLLELAVERATESDRDLVFLSTPDLLMVA